MYQFTIQGSPILMVFCDSILFISAITILAEDPKRPIFFISFIHTFFCWSTLSQIMKFHFVLNWEIMVEQVLGTSSFVSLLLYGFIAYFPLFIFVLIKEGIEFHFPLFLFVPCTLFAYYSLNLPDTIYKIGSSKLLYSIAMLLCLYDSCVPYSYFALIACFFGEYLFERDYFGFSKKLSDLIDGVIEIATNNEEFRNGILPDSDINMDSLRQLTSMGFSESDARNALQMTHGDVNAAAEYITDML